MAGRAERRSVTSVLTLGTWLIAYLRTRKGTTRYSANRIPSDFGWTGPLLVNDEAQALVHPRHIENPYCLAELPAEQMDVIHKGEGLRLKFG